jgi:alcohol dehydrogenase
MTTFRAAHVTSPGAKLAMIDRTMADPGPGTVRVAVEACGSPISFLFAVSALRPPRARRHVQSDRLAKPGEGVADIEV